MEQQRSDRGRMRNIELRSEYEWEMDTWLQEQQFLETDKMISRKEGLLASRQLYFNSRRCTQSDVISIVSTIDIEQDGQWDDVLKGQREELDGRELDNLMKGMYKSPFEPRKPTGLGKIHGKASTSGSNNNNSSDKDLRWEEATFMTKLGVRREKRAALEYEAANLIQRVARGWLLRRWLKRNSGKLRLQQKMKRSYQVISKQIRLKLELAEAAKKTEEYREQAAITIQSGCRRFLAKRFVRKEKHVRHIERLNVAATLICAFVRKSFGKRCLSCIKDRCESERVIRAVLAIQKTFRMFHYGRKVLLNMKAKRYRKSMVRIQCFWRSIVAKKYVELEKEREELNRKSKAAFTIQALVRGVNSRSCFERIHNEHDALLRAAAALTIQRVFRGWIYGRARVKFMWDCVLRIRKQWATIHVQRFIRGCLARIRANNIRTSMETDIFFQAKIGNRVQVEDLHMINSCVEAEDINGDTVFTIACRQGHKKIVRKCLKWGLDINHKNDFGLSGVTLATRNGHGELAEILVTKKAEIPKFGRTLLHDASYMRLEGVVMALLARDQDVNANDPSDHSRAPIHKVLLNARCKTSPLPVLKVLVEIGKADVNAVDDEGSTALHLAADSGMIPVIEYLIQAGASVTKQDRQKKTPWRRALLQNNEDCMALLRDGWQAIVEEGSEELVDPVETKRFIDVPESLIQIVLDKGDKVLLKTQAAVDEGFKLNAHSRQGLNLLMAAAKVGALETVRLFLARRKGPREEISHYHDNKRRGVLHYAAPHEKILQILLKEMVEPVEALQAQDSEGITPLHLIANNGKIPEKVFRLIKRGEIVLDELVDSQGNTPLHYAAFVAAEAAVASLLDLGATCFAKNQLGNSPLHHMATNPDIDEISSVAADLLMDGVKTRNNKEQTALHVATYYGCPQLLTQLFNKFGDLIFEKDADNLTPYHLAVHKDNAICLDILLDGAGDGCDETLIVELLNEAGKFDHVKCCERLLAALNPESESLNLEPVLDTCIAKNSAQVARLILNTQSQALAGIEQFQNAISLGNAKVLGIMLDFWEHENAFPFQVDKKALAMRVVTSDQSDCPESLKVLLALEGTTKTKVDLPLVHAAARSGNLECLKYLASLDPQVIHQPLAEEKNQTPMHMATLHGHVPIVQWLMQNKADHQNVLDEDGNTPMMLAKEEVLDFFVEAEEN